MYARALQFGIASHKGWVVVMSNLHRNNIGNDVKNIVIT